MHVCGFVCIEMNLFQFCFDKKLNIKYINEVKITDIRYGERERNKTQRSDYNYR